MDFQPDGNRQTQNSSSYQQYQNISGNGSNAMTTAAVILSTIAISTICCIYPAFICGALGIIFALLSKGGNMNMSTTSRTALWISASAMVLAVILAVSAVAYVILQYGSVDAFWDAYLKMAESYYSR